METFIPDKKIRVLLTDGTNKNCLAAVKSLHKAGYVVGVISRSTQGYAVLTRYASYRIICKDEDLIKAIKYSLKKFKPKIVIPIGDNSVKAIYKDQYIMNNVLVPISNQESLDIATNKFNSTKFLNQHGIPVPEFEIISYDNFSIDHAVHKFGFPIVLKGPFGTNSSQVRICKNSDELKKYSDELFTSNKEIMVQKYINGKGTGYFALFCNGKELAFFMHRRIREYPIRGGPSVCAESIFQKDLRDIGKQCLTLLNWHGVGMIEFKREFGTNKLWFIEINPKFWGSLELSIKSGVDFPKLLVNMTLDNTLCEKKADLGYILGYRFQWLFPGEVLHFLETFKVIQTIKGIMFYNYRLSGHDFSIRDPYPSLIGIRSSIKAIGRSIINKIKF